MSLYQSARWPPDLKINVLYIQERNQDIRALSFSIYIVPARKFPAGSPITRVTSRVLKNVFLSAPER
jgi:hypothetical protein